ncbi:hypothetical protein [Streptomyces sp. NPDC059176]|uniref:hypothetical protein n=1 Tax=unclassified Streptomyces TaxID=2593676 RepID=UPI0036AFA06E
MALNANDVDAFVANLRNGLIEAPVDHQTTDQDNFALRSATTERLQRPVATVDGEVVEMVGTDLLGGVIRSRQAQAHVWLQPEARLRSAVWLPLQSSENR